MSHDLRQGGGRITPTSTRLLLIMSGGLKHRAKEELQAVNEFISQSLTSKGASLYIITGDMETFTVFSCAGSVLSFTLYQHVKPV